VGLVGCVRHTAIQMNIAKAIAAEPRAFEVWLGR
jgi:hypothetical protein